MGKKRAREADGQSTPAVASADKMDHDGSSDDEDFDIVNVDFEWFNFDTEIDFHGVKGLLRQLFDVDAQLFDMSGLTDVVLEQNTIGSTVKVDSKANDAYAFLTALNLREHREKKPVADLISYLSSKAGQSNNETLAATVPKILAENHVGLVLGERLINMPPEISPPMYSMLVDELEAAVEDKEPYDFTHYLVVSKTYNEVQSILDDGARKNKKAKEEAPMFYFHPEDEILKKHAIATGSFPFTKDDESVADSKRAFQEMGVKSMGYMTLIEAAKFPAAVRAVADYMNPQ
ncbi:p21-C-terminal region-binding protein-domain-containing protein [Coniella lustricola]|uniref:Protein BCP1 n=1 Tax=Coniella lustricola TaxID=2025994 RepID=A0A2T3A0R4_9PEZI|nr:p21-C-terminal region-binding protein-domain-containing protein [Coniella lustricola]